MWKAAGITIGLGMALILLEWLMARRKKGGITFTDKQRMFGILRVSLVLAALVASIVWMSE